MKSYHFHLDAGKELYLNMDTTPEGFILLNRFVPDYLTMTYNSSLVTSESNSLDLNEFENDCRNMINIFNKHGLNYRDGGNSFAVLEALVIAHIRQFGRLVFGDLLTYVSEICELMSAMGYSTSTLKVLYPNFVGAIVERHGSYIKESLPGSMFAAPSLINFTSSERCKRLAEMTPRLTKIPTI